VEDECNVIRTHARLASEGDGHVKTVFDSSLLSKKVEEKRSRSVLRCLGISCSHFKSLQDRELVRVS
jgi:hypothetical protein